MKPSDGYILKFSKFSVRLSKSKSKYIIILCNDINWQDYRTLMVIKNESIYLWADILKDFFYL